jgi:Tol biopolymer transport system component
MELRIFHPAALCAALVLGLASTAAPAARFELVNQTSITVPIESNAQSNAPLSVSHDGRFALFASEADNLVAGDSHRGNDLFVFDAQSGTLERVSVGTGGLQPNGDIGLVGGMSGDGRYVVFNTNATNLTVSPTYGQHQVYLRDRVANTTTLLTAFPSGATAFGSAENPRISADARYVAFDTFSSMVDGDTNSLRDVYRLDRQTGVFEMMSVSEDGRLGNAASYEPQISADGSTVAFYTYANNLVAGDTNTFWDIVLRKPAAGRTQRVSVTSSGGELQDYPYIPRTGALSADGRYVVFNSWQPAVSGDSNNQGDGVRFDSSDASVQRITLNSSGAEIAYGAHVTSISADGQSVTFVSGGEVLPGLSSSFQRLFLRHTGTGAVTHLALRPGAEAWGDEVYDTALSGDANVAYASSPTDSLVDAERNGFVDTFRREVAAASASRVSRPAQGTEAAAANNHSGGYIQGFGASSDGRWVVFSSSADNLVPGDTNGSDDIFLRDRQLGTTQRISLTSSGQQAFCRSQFPHITPDGRYIVFASCGLLLPSADFNFQIYRYDRQLQQLSLVSANASGQPGDSGSVDSSISDDGRYVAFHSWAGNLTPGDSPGYDVFVRDMDSSLVLLASGSHDGAAVQYNRNLAQISGDGRYVVLEGDSDNLVPGDTNSAWDVFVYDRVSQTTERVSLSNTGEQLPGGGGSASITHDGSQVAFIAQQGGSGPQQVLLRNRSAQTTELVSVNSAGTALDNGGYSPRLSADGRRVVFLSVATNAGGEYESNRPIKLLLRERDLGRTTRLRGFAEYSDYVFKPQFTPDGEHVLFSTHANDVVPADGNNRFRDVFIASGIGDQLFDDGFEQIP